MILQRRRGINTDQIAKGKQKGRVFYTELIMKLATYLVVAAEIFSIVLGNPHFSNPIAIFGAVLGVTGVLIFTVSIVTMKDSWRAGIAETERTQMVTQGIYQFSRNPAFLGFDCVYLGLLMMFFNLPLLFFPCAPWSCSICKFCRRNDAYQKYLDKIIPITRKPYAGIWEENTGNRSAKGTRPFLSGRVLSL